MRTTIPIIRVCTVLILLLFCACNSDRNGPTENRSAPEAFNCPECPALEPGADTLEFVRNVRRFVARVSDTGLISDQLCRRFLEFGVEEFPVAECLRIFEHDTDRASCGVVAKLMAKILIENGMDAYTYSFGLDKLRLTHEVVLFKYRNRLCISDPFINYDLLQTDELPMDLITLIELVSKDSLQFKTSTDSVKYDMLINEHLLTEPMRKRMIDPACNWPIHDRIPVRDSVYKFRLDRCFDCDRNSCFSFIKRFEDGLKKETSFTQFHEGYVIKTRPLWGADDHLQMDDLIETAIYSQPDLGKRVRKRL